jgi:hypothetical protein
MGKLIDITGENYGALTVLEYVGNGHFKCKCAACDGERALWGPDLRRGRYKTCGCRKKFSKDKLAKEDKQPVPAKQTVPTPKPEEKETPAERKARKRAEKVAKQKEKKSEPQLVVKNGKTYPKSAKVVELNGELRYLAELCEETGMKAAKVRDRLRSGWTVKQALDLETRNK